MNGNGCAYVPGSKPGAWNIFFSSFFAARCVHTSLHLHLSYLQYVLGFSILSRMFVPGSNPNLWHNNASLKLVSLIYSFHCSKQFQNKRRTGICANSVLSSLTACIMAATMRLPLPGTSAVDSRRNGRSGKEFHRVRQISL
jgi:hypothetical protein